jgi:hypothetical protein
MPTYVEITVRTVCSYVRESMPVSYERSNLRVLNGTRVVCGARQLEDALCEVMQVEDANMVSNAVEDASYEVIPMEPCII